jgi:hypothetical protein
MISSRGEWVLETENRMRVADINVRRHPKGKVNTNRRTISRRPET